MQGLYYLKHKERIKLYYQNNKESIKQYKLKNKSSIQLLQHQYNLTHKPTIKITKHLYWLKNKHKIQQTHHHYYLNHKDSLKHSQKQYYTTHKPLILLKAQQYREKNKELIRKIQKEYYLNHKHLIKLAYVSKRKGRVWKSPEMVREFFEVAKERLFVREMEDWYRVSQVQMASVGGGSVYTLFGNLGRALKYAFPDVEWDQGRFSWRGKKSRQWWLRVVLQQILGEKTIIVEDFLHPQLFWDGTKHRMELDIWVPEFKIGLEYQGEHHYHDLCFYGPGGTLSLYTQRDEKKKKACSENQITLIVIPYWWDGRKESLSATLFSIRPDIFPTSHYPKIPVSPNTTPRGHSIYPLLPFGHTSLPSLW